MIKQANKSAANDLELALMRLEPTNRLSDTNCDIAEVRSVI